jgi:hypothetical protein
MGQSIAAASKPEEYLTQALDRVIFSAVALFDLSEYLTESTVIVLLRGFVDLRFLVVLFPGFSRLHHTIESIGEGLIG